MTEIKATRGRPKLAHEDNETRERILSTAQKLFAEKGFDKVTLRELTSAANTNLAAVNYYFGSKDKLLHALIRSAAKTIHQERMSLFKEAEEFEGSLEEKIRKVIYSLLAPAIGKVGDANPEFLYSTLLARTLSNGPTELTDMVERQTSHLTPYAEALKKLLPTVPEQEIYWRLHFVLNIEHSVHTELKRLDHFSGGICDTSDREALLERILDFVIPGIIAGTISDKNFS